MKIYELAKELKVQSKEIVTLIKECGEENVTHMSSLTDEQIEFIRSEYETVKAIKEEEKAEQERLEQERIEKEKSKKKMDADYRPDEMISCRSIFPGVLIFNGAHSGMTYTFNGMGDRRNIEYQDLKAGMLQQHSMMFNPDFIIEDYGLINDERWAELKAVYEKMVTDEEIKKVMNLPTRQFKEAFLTLPVTARQSIITLIATQIENKTFDEYSKAQFIDNECGTCLQLKMQMLNDK